MLFLSINGLFREHQLATKDLSRRNLLLALPGLCIIHLACQEYPGQKTPQKKCRKGGFVLFSHSPRLLRSQAVITIRVSERTQTPLTFAKKVRSYRRLPVHGGRCILTRSLFQRFKSYPHPRLPYPEQGCIACSSWPCRCVWQPTLGPSATKWKHTSMRSSCTCIRARPGGTTR